MEIEDTSSDRMLNENSRQDKTQDLIVNECGTEITEKEDESLIKELKSLKKDVQEKDDVIMKMNEQMEQETNRFKKSVADMENEIAILKTQVKSLQKCIVEKDTEIKETCKENEKKISQLQKDVKETNYSKTKYKNRVKDMMTENESSKKLVNEYYTDIVKLKEENKKIEVEIRKMNISRIEKEIKIRKDMKIVRIHPEMMKSTKSIGQGGFGSVVESIINGKKIAVKVVDIIREYEGKDVWDYTSVNDLLMMSRIRGDHIIHASHFGFCYVADLKECKILIGMEFMTEDLGKYCSNRVNMKNESWKPSILLQTLQCLEQLHAIPVMHRDVKPENFLVKDGHVKISDFGMSVMADWSKGLSGTPGYMAPEVSNGHHYNLKADMYSLGSVHHQVITRYRLFPSENCLPRWHQASAFMSR